MNIEQDETKHLCCFQEDFEGLNLESLLPKSLSVNGGKESPSKALEGGDENEEK